jgi:ankyrin repeat protein
MDEELFNAVRQNNPNRVRELIENGADIEAKEFGYTPLEKAVLYSGPEMVRLLIDLGADIERSSFGRTPLMHAISGNKPDMVRLLIDLGANIEASEFGNTPLIIAVDYNIPAMVRLLTELGANIEGLNNVGITPLMRAAIYQKNPDMVRLLIELGADINTTDNIGRTIIDMLTYRDDQPMIDVIRKAVRTREIKEKNAKIRAQKMAYYTSLIKSEDLPRNESAPLSGLYSGIDYNPYIARHIADFAFGEEENEEGAEESKRSDSGSRRRKSGARKKSKR